MLSALLSSGIGIIERSSTVGSGEIGRYVVRSDSLADSFLKAVDLDDTGTFRGLLGQPAGRYLDAQRGKPADLGAIGAFLADVAAATREPLRATGEDPFITGHEALRADCRHDGSWTTSCMDAKGSVCAFRSSNLVLATGANQPLARLYTEEVAGVPLLPRFSSRLIQSAEFLGREAQQKLHQIAGGHPIQKVAIVGGSHSAIASAHRCLFGSHGEVPDAQVVTVLHRSALRLTYASPDAAVLDGYTAFGPADVCPKSGRVYPLAGFRSDSRDLLRQHWELGGLKRDSRLHLLQLSEQQFGQANEVLQNADLIIAALGYRPRALPLFDPNGEPIRLLCENGTSPLVDDKSRVLDSTGCPIHRVFGIGLSAGYPLAGIHGESSFKGQANGLALWQGDIGADLVAALLAGAQAGAHAKHPC